MCGSLIKGPKKASKGRLNEIDSTEKGEKKKRNCRAREKWNSCCSLKFLGRLNRNKICRLFVLQKKEPGGIQRTTRVYIKPVENVLFR